MVSILVLIPDSAYMLKIHYIMREASDVDGRILYVTLNKTYRSLDQQFKAVGINVVHYIDAISSSFLRPSTEFGDCTYISITLGLDDLHDLVVRLVRKHAIDFVVFDSLSSLAVYRRAEDIMRFVPRLIASLSLLDCSIIMTVLTNDEYRPEIRHVKMSVDKVLRMS